VGKDRNTNKNSWGMRINTHIISKNIIKYGDKLACKLG
jgi:hypothetical protein